MLWEIEIHPAAHLPDREAERVRGQCQALGAASIRQVRSARSFLIAKLGAEYVARILPAGTHDWRKFLPPATLAGLLRDAGLSVLATTGLGPRPPFGRWATGADLSVNYLIVAAKPAA